MTLNKINSMSHSESTVTHHPCIKELFSCRIAPKIQGIQNFVDESERISHKGQADRLLCCFKKETLQFSDNLLPMSHQ